MAIGMQGKPSPKKPAQVRTPQTRTTRGASRGGHQKAPSIELEDDYDDVDDEGGFDIEPPKKGPGFNPKFIAIGAFVVVIVVLLIFLLKNSGEDLDEEYNVSQDSGTSIGDVVDQVADQVSDDIIYDSEGNPIYDADGKYIGDGSSSSSDDSETFSIGYDYSFDESTTEVPPISGSGDGLIKDLNGQDIEQNYNVSEYHYLDDFVNYEVKRGILEDGFEIYWMEIDYKDKHYRTQISYYEMKHLDKKGICKVEIEVLYLVGGGTVITHMEPVFDE